MTRTLQAGSLVIATHNAGKLSEMRDLLKPYGMKCLSAGSLGLPEPDESGTTFAQNALLKARAAAQASGLPAIADDSGIAVAALDGRPGVYTADWAMRQWFEGSPKRDWYMAMGKVEGMLQALDPAPERSASFHCVLALAWPDDHYAIYEGRIDGHVVWPPRGKLGFGYDPVFVANGLTQTFGEMDPEEKRAISHRSDAFARLAADQFGATP